jgi:phenylacetate-CoA ligase
MWRKWILNGENKLLTILARHKEDTIIGSAYVKKLAPIKVIQQYVDEIQPQYIFTYPSIIAQLDLTRLTNLKDIRSVGEIGATSYSCEEAGTIALTCPQNPDVYHIMENIVVESHPEHGAVITDLTNPVITRYVLGDQIQLCDPDEQCKCGRKLPMIRKIHGRVRNMLVLPDGDKIWPTIGEPLFTTVTNKILKHQAVQTSVNKVELHIKVSSRLTDEEHKKLLDLVNRSLQQPHIEVQLIYTNGFKPGKFEAFKCQVR